MSISNSDHLRRKIDLIYLNSGVGQQLLSHPDFRGLYPEFLFTVHTMIRASVPLMEEAQAQCLKRPDDPVATAMAGYLEQHIKEERHHDIWCLDDLQTVGVAAEEVARRVPSPTVASLVGSQYYWMKHYHPLALLGYIAVIEGYPPQEALVDHMQTITDYPREAFSTLLKHARLDPHHKKDLDQFLNSLTLSDEQLSILGLSAIHTVQLVIQTYKDVLDAHDEAAPALSA
ncbi:MAG: hypothetical protein GKR89_06735 [Candidatus Latescibacteria bacterium]|nr:hypothetical protein [Candidatus Latescibacterota bacterium]